MLLRISQHYVLQQRHFAAALGVHGVRHQVEVRGRKKISHGDPEDRQIGRHAGRVHPKISGQHLVSFEPELLVEPTVVSWHALDLQDLRALIERRLDGAIVQGIWFHCTNAFLSRKQLCAPLHTLSSYLRLFIQVLLLKGRYFHTSAVCYFLKNSRYISSEKRKKKNRAICKIKKNFPWHSTRIRYKVEAISVKYNGINKKDTLHCRKN